MSKFILFEKRILSSSLTIEGQTTGIILENTHPYNGKQIETFIHEADVNRLVPELIAWQKAHKSWKPKPAEGVKS